MRPRYRQATVVALIALLGACDWTSLTFDPPTILTDDQTWGDPTMIRAVLADYYDRVPSHHDFQNEGQRRDLAAYDEALFSGLTGGGLNNQINYAYSRWDAWTQVYSLNRDINLAINRIGKTQSPRVTEAMKKELLAEFRFIRAYNYFLLAIREGGVPLITEELIYDFSGDPSSLQVPRSTEAQVYEFVASEMDDIQGSLGNVGSVTRANRYTALALKSRAMLYAASLARHNSEMASPITLPGGIVGIPSSRAVEFYTKSLEASRALINSGVYQLYGGNPNAGDNFYEAVNRKTGNKEVIMVTDYLASQGRSHAYTRDAIPHSMVIDQAVTVGGSVFSPTLQWVMTYDRLDGSPGTMQGVGNGTVASQANWTFYDKPGDIFAGRDGRLYGSILLPGSSFAGKELQLQAGVYVWNQAANRYDRFTGAAGSTYSDGGVLTGMDGPIVDQSYISTTGFLVRKWLDTNPSGWSSASDSDVWWVRFRLGEIYLNAAEAAFELGDVAGALGYINTLRVRAGFPPNSLTTLTRNKIRSERWAELAFEDHRVWDLKRWRIAHLVWDGTSDSPTANALALYSYRIVRPGHPNHNKYVFDQIKAARQLTPRFFRLGNYYSEIPNGVISNNPKLIRNPFH